MDVSKILQPGIDIGGFILMEPTTVITDFLISALCFWFWYKLKPHRDKDSVRFASYFFFFLGWAATIGAIFGHGLIHYVVEPGTAMTYYKDGAFIPVPDHYTSQFWHAKYWRLPGWITSMFAVAFMERSAISHANRYISEKLGRGFLIMNVIEMIILLTITCITIHFKFVEIHSAYGFLVVVLFFHIYNYIKSYQEVQKQNPNLGRDKGSFLMLVNTGILLMTAFIYNYPVILHEFFNHRDLGHMFMCLSCYCVYLATINLGNHGDIKWKMS